MNRPKRIIDCLSPDRVEAFHAKVNTAGDDECWLWAGAANKDGYGSFKLRRFGSVGAHRVAWCIANGVDPGKNHVLHTCDNPPCVNPSHLWLGDPLLNALDKVGKGRARGRFSDYEVQSVPPAPVSREAPKNDLPWFLRGLPGG